MTIWELLSLLKIKYRIFIYMGSQISFANLPLCGLCSICSCYYKTDDEEVITDPVILAKIRNKEYEEYIQNSKPKKHIILYRLNRPDLYDS